jgi:hypothetical protein
VEEFCEVVHISTPTSRGEHVLGEMEYVLVLPLPILGVKESLNMASCIGDCVRVHYSAVEPSSVSLETEPVHRCKLGPLGRPRRRCKNNSGCVDWIDVAQERSMWRAVVSTVVNCRVS